MTRWYPSGSPYQQQDVTEDRPGAQVKHPVPGSEERLERAPVRVRPAIDKHATDEPQAKGNQDQVLACRRRVTGPDAARPTCKDLRTS